MNSKPLLNLALRTGFSGLARHNAALNSSAQRAVMSYGSGIRTLVTNRHLAPGLYQGAKSAANQDLMRDRSVDPRYSFKAFSTGTGESTADDDSSARAARYHWVDKVSHSLRFFSSSYFLNPGRV